MFYKIIDPFNMNKYSVNSIKGKLLLKNYVKNYYKMVGGDFERINLAEGRSEWMEKNKERYRKNCCRKYFRGLLRKKCKNDNKFSIDSSRTLFPRKTSDKFEKYKTCNEEINFGDAISYGKETKTEMKTIPIKETSKITETGVTADANRMKDKLEKERRRLKKVKNKVMEDLKYATWKEGEG